MTAYDHHLPRPALIIDIDGTISDNEDRVEKAKAELPDMTPDDLYFWDHCNRYIPLDGPIEKARDFLAAAHEAGYALLYVSARRNTYLRETLLWMHIHQFPLTEIYLKPYGFRNTEWKVSIFNILKQCYTVVMTYGDREHDREVAQMCDLPFTKVGKEWTPERFYFHPWPEPLEGLPAREEIHRPDNGEDHSDRLRARGAVDTEHGTDTTDHLDGPIEADQQTGQVAVE
jgi:hypothetical protein